MPESLPAFLRRHEGLRLKPYKDTEDILTIGYGRNLADVGISNLEAEFLLHNDIFRAVTDLIFILPEASRMSEARRTALTSVMFNLGRTRFLTFERMIAALRRDNFEEAAFELLNSKRGRQLKNRSLEEAEMLRSGK